MHLKDVEGHEVDGGVLRWRPGQKIVFTTTHDQNYLQSRLGELPGSAGHQIIVKPFDFSQLLSRMPSKPRFRGLPLAHNGNAIQSDPVTGCAVDLRRQRAFDLKNVRRLRIARVQSDNLNHLAAEEPLAPDSLIKWIGIKHVTGPDLQRDEEWVVPSFPRIARRRGRWRGRPPGVWLMAAPDAGTNIEQPGFRRYARQPDC